MPTKIDRHRARASPLPKGPRVIYHTQDLLVSAKFYPASQLPILWQQNLLVRRIVEAIRAPKIGSIRDPWTLANGLPLRVYLLTKRNEIFAPQIQNIPGSEKAIGRWLKDTVQSYSCSKCGKPNFALIVELGKAKWAKVAIECGELRILGGNLKEEDLKGGSNEKTAREKEKEN